MNELKFEDAKKYYNELIEAFTKFINNDKEVFNYNTKFNISDIDKVHEETMYLMENPIDEVTKKVILEEVKNKVYSKRMFNEIIKIQREHRDKIINVDILEEVVRMSYEKKFDELVQAFSDVPLTDYYFIYNNKLYTLDIVIDFDDLGYNDEYFYYKYKDDYQNLICCNLIEYKEYFETDDEKLDITFAYDTKKKQVVEVMNLYRYGYLTREATNNTLRRILK